MTMKKLILSILVPAALAVGFAPTAEAGRGCGGSTWVSGYSRCGCPIYVGRYVAGYDCWGRPVFHTRTLPIRHACHSRGYGVRIHLLPRPPAGPVLRPTIRCWTPPRPYHPHHFGCR
jgi:hypothetical protein